MACCSNRSSSCSAVNCYIPCIAIINIFLSRILDSIKFILIAISACRICLLASRCYSFRICSSSISSWVLFPCSSIIFSLSFVFSLFSFRFSCFRLSMRLSVVRLSSFRLDSSLMASSKFNVYACGCCDSWGWLLYYCWLPVSSLLREFVRNTLC